MAKSIGTSTESVINWEYKNPILIDHIDPPPAKHPDPQKLFYCILDVEATCNQTNLGQKIHLQPCAEVISLSSQIIQGEQLISTFHSLVRPVFNNISEFCTELTGISDNMLRVGGADLQHVLERYEKWISHLRMRYNMGPNDLHFVTFGSWDILKAIPRNCEHRLIDLPPCLKEARKEFINIRKQSSILNNTKEPESISEMLKDVAMQFEGREHTSMADVQNIARFLQFLDKKDIRLRPSGQQSVQERPYNPVSNSLTINITEEPVIKGDGATGLLAEVKELSENDRMEFMQEMACQEQLPKEL